MAKTTITVKKTDLKKVLAANRIRGTKASNMKAIGEQVVLELDYRNPSDLWEAALLFPSVSGTEFDAEDKAAADKKAKQTA